MGVAGIIAAALHVMRRQGLTWNQEVPVWTFVTSLFLAWYCYDFSHHPFIYATLSVQTASLNWTPPPKNEVSPWGGCTCCPLALPCTLTGAALLENNEASAKLTTANGGTFTSSSARFSSQSRYSTLYQWMTCFNVIVWWDWLSSM